MADETKIPGPGETPGPPAAEKGVIPGVTDPPASSDKVINLSEVLEGAGGSDGAAVAGKKTRPRRRRAIPLLAPPKRARPWRTMKGKSGKYPAPNWRPGSRSPSGAALPKRRKARIPPARANGPRMVRVGRPPPARRAALPRPPQRRGLSRRTPRPPQLTRPRPATLPAAWRRRLNISTCPSCTPPR